MKKIVCDLCECTEFTKEGGFFICQGCGTKYSLEEAKSMMKEVEGSAPVSSGTPVASVLLGNPNQQQLDNILVLATTAYEASNYKEAENYCNRAIELDVMAYKAWFLKAKAVGWSSKTGNLRIEEAAHSFCKAIDFAPVEEKEDVKKQSIEELKQLGLALASLRKNNFIRTIAADEVDGFSADMKVLIESLTVLLAHGNAISMPEGYLESIANIMAEGAKSALANVKKVYDGKLGNFETKMDYTLKLNTIRILYRKSIEICDDDEDSDLPRYKALRDLLNDGSYMVMMYLVGGKIKAEFEQDKRECDNKIAELEKKLADKKATEARKAEEEKQARIKAYWEAHADEKASLESEKKSLEDKKAKFTADFADLDNQITAATPSGKVPSEDETDKLKDQIRDLENQCAKLGMFAGKQKKQIGEEIASLSGRVDSLKSKIEEEKKARQAEADKKVAPLKEKKSELQSQLDAATKRINAIDTELTKDPEA